MAYLSLYRKYRSQTFSDLVGQDQVVRTLQNSILQGKVAHAFLFTGPRGTGKTSSARLLAKALNCEKGPNPEPCNECETCKAITIGNCLDVVEMDAASQSGVDDIREKIVQAAEYRPAYCRYKVFIIDEVHDLSPKGFDALLKTIEEPPEQIVFVLATTEYSKVPPTIRARCQKYDFHRATISNLVHRLEQVAAAEGIEAEPAGLIAIARLADGGYRDALTLLEQAMIVGEGKVTLSQVYDQLGLVSEEAVDQILLAIKEGDVKRLMTTLNEVYRLGRDPRVVLESMLYRLSELTRAAYGVDIGGDEDAAIEASLHEVAARLGRETMNRLRAKLADAHKDVRDVSIPRLWLEAELVSLATGPLPVQAAPSSAPVEKAAPRAASPAPVATPTAVVETRPSIPEPELSGDAELDEMRRKWKEVLVGLASKSKTAHAKLSTVTVACYSDGVVVLEFSREMDLDWVRESNKRQALILEEIRTVVGEPGWTLEYRLKKNGTVMADAVEAVAVELPAEGARLAELAREVFEGA